MPKKQKKISITRMLLTLFFVFGFCAFTGGAQSEECLSYEPAKVSLTGTIVRETFPGRPNYESIKDGDEIETYWILKPEKPVCVNGKENDEMNFESYSNIKAIQLVFHGGSDYKKYGSLLYKKVSASGTLFQAHTGHHRSRVLLEVIGMEPAKDGNKK